MRSEGRAPSSPCPSQSGPLRLLQLSGSPKIASSEVLFRTQVPRPFTGTLLRANLASEFISQPGHTGIMDTTLCVAIGAVAAGPDASRLPRPPLRVEPSGTATPSREMGLKWEQNAPFFEVHFCKPWISRGLQTLRYNVVPFFRLTAAAPRGAKTLPVPLPHLYRFWRGQVRERRGAGSGVPVRRDLARIFTSSLPISGPRVSTLCTLNS